MCLPFVYGYFSNLCLNQDFQFSGILHPVIIPDNQELTIDLTFVPIEARLGLPKVALLSNDMFCEFTQLKKSCKLLILF